MWHLKTWFSGGLGGAGQMVGLDHLKGLFQPKQFHDSVAGLLLPPSLPPARAGCPQRSPLPQGSLQEELGCGLGRLPCPVTPRDVGAQGSEGQQPFPAGSQVTHLQWMQTGTLSSGW